MPASPAARAGHRVYLKRMLLAEGAEGLLPEWAFFARCVVDTTELRPTASREALYEDTLLEDDADALGDQLRDWLVRLATEDRRRVTEFLNVHRLGVKALAVHDDEMLRLVERYWPMETNVGPDDARRLPGGTRGASATSCRSRTSGRSARVAAAQGMPLVNAGYEFDTKIIERLPQAEPGTLIERVEPSDLTTHFDQLDLGVELAQRPFVAAGPAGRRPARLRGRAAIVRSGRAARAVSGQQLGRVRRRAPRHPRPGRRRVGRCPGRPGQDRRRPTGRSSCSTTAIRWYGGSAS